MPHKHGWFIENRIFYNQYHGDVSAEEVQQMAITNLKYLDDSEAPLVHCFVDIENIGSIPLRFNALKESAQMSLDHPKIGWIIAYGKDNRFVTFLGTMVTQFFKSRYRLFKTYEEAIEFLQSMDATLPDLKAADNPSRATR